MPLPNSLKELDVLVQGFDSKKFCQRFPDAWARVDRLGKIQKHTYQNPHLALLALVHRSSLVHWPEDKGGIFSNEKLEFFGDALLDFVLTVELMVRHPKHQEGGLSQLRASLVGTENLAQKGLELNLTELMFYEGKIGHQPNFLADSFEAIAAALAIDGGFDVAKAWLLSIFSQDVLDFRLNGVTLDAKGQFQSWVQKVIPCAPTYKITNQGTPQSPLFEVVACICDVEIARTQGPNKREATKHAAKKALEQIEKGHLTVQDVLSYYEKTL